MNSHMVEARIATPNRKKNKRISSTHQQFFRQNDDRKRFRLSFSCFASVVISATFSAFFLRLLDGRCHKNAPITRNQDKLFANNGISECERGKNTKEWSGTKWKEKRRASFLHRRRRCHCAFIVAWCRPSFASVSFARMNIERFIVLRLKIYYARNVQPFGIKM